MNVEIKKFVPPQLNYIILNYMQMGILPRHMSTCDYSAFTSQKTTLDPQEATMWVLGLKPGFSRATTEPLLRATVRSSEEIQQIGTVF